jgi:hypothetical protein
MLNNITFAGQDRRIICHERGDMLEPEVSFLLSPLEISCAHLSKRDPM